MNFKQRNIYVLLDGTMGPLKLCFCLFNTKTFAMLVIFFTYYAWKPMHMGSIKFKCESSCNYCKVKVFYCQEPPSGESTPTECGVNYQLLSVITEVAQWGTPSCSRPQTATDNGVRDSRSN